MIPEGWETYILDDLSERITSGGTPLTTRSDYYGGTIPWLKTQEINFNRIYDTETYISELGKENSSAKWISENSVIVAMYGATAGKIALTKIPLTTNQACCNITLNPRLADYNFIYYNLLSRYSEILRMATGAAQQNLNAGMLKDLLIAVPDLQEQSRIASILSSLDNKIELNIQINKTLEAIAQTIFKEWFVDFKFPGFDGELVDGLPKGWINGNLGDYCRIFRGASPRPITDPKYFKNGTIPWIKIADATSENSIYITKSKDYCTELAITKSRYIRKGTLVLSNSATVGIPKILNIDGCVHDGWLVFDNYKLITRNYLFFILYNNLSRFISYADGSVQKNLNTEILKNLKFIIPDWNIVCKFDLLSQTLFDKILSDEVENQILVNLRNTLLPKLMTGKIRVA